jgi:hypothetical protein
VRAVDVRAPLLPTDRQRSLFADVPEVRRCRRCGRVLRDAGSIEAGLGPVCVRLYDAVADARRRREHVVDIH